MPSIAGTFAIHSRTDRPGEWELSINLASGLPASTCAAWRRRSLRSAPPEFLASITWPKSQAAANRTASALIEHLRSTGAAPAGRGTSVEAWVRLFLDPSTSPRAEKLLSEGKEYSPSSVGEYRSKINGHVLTDPVLISKTMEATTQQDLEAYFARLARKLGGPCRTLQATWTIMRMMWRSYRQAHRGFMDPFEDMTKPKYPKVKRGSLEEDELLTIFSKDGVFKSPLEKVVCALAFLSGLRRGEVFAVEPGDLDRVGKRIDVEHNWRAFGRKDKELGLPKWDKIRTAPLSKITIKAIDALEAAQGIHERVCVFPNGKTPSERWWTNHVGACLRRAGIDTAGRKITPHSSRHSIASVLYARGTPLKPIQEMLGHSDLSTTDLYIHTPAGAIDEITGAIDRATGPAARRGRVKGKAKNTDRSWE